MKHYFSPSITVCHITPSLLIATSITDVRDNVGFTYRGGASEDFDARTKDAGDWDIWGED